MSTALFTELSNYFNMDVEDPLYQKDLIRPAEIKEDVKLMEQRQRVTKIMKSKMFKKELENIVKMNSLDGEFDGTPTSTLSLAEISEQLLLAALPKNKLQNFAQLTNRKGFICINDLYSGSSSAYGLLESQFRCKLASIFRLIDMYGWNSGFNTTITARPFRDQEHFLINPFGLMYHEVTASSFLSIDFKGNINDFGSTVLEAHHSAWLIHAALYAFRSDIRAILHLKTPSAVAISCMDHGLLPICRESIILGQAVTLHELSGLEQQIAQSTSRILADIKNYLINCHVTSDTRLLLLPNQGFLVCGTSIEHAWHLLTNCQIACDTQLKLGSIDLDDIILPDDLSQQEVIQDANATRTMEIQTDFGVEQMNVEELEFEALMRHLDNHGYRTGYFYRQQNIYNDRMVIQQQPQQQQESKISDVEIPASSTYYDRASSQDTRLHNASLHQKSGMSKSSDKWFNTPNKYKPVLVSSGEGDHHQATTQSFLLDGNTLTTGKQSASGCPITNSASDSATRTKWVSACPSSGISESRPQKPVTAGACVPFDHVDRNSAATASHKPRAVYISPREIIENQRRLRNKYYNDTNTAGPISCLLDNGMSREEALRMKTESLRRQMMSPDRSSTDNLITSASKGIIQRGHHALVYQELYRPANPFENVSSADLDEYHREIDRKHHPHLYASSLDRGVDYLGLQEEDTTAADTDGAVNDTICGMQSEPELLSERHGKYKPDMFVQREVDDFFNGTAAVASTPIIGSSTPLSTDSSRGSLLDDATDECYLSPLVKSKSRPNTSGIGLASNPNTHAPNVGTTDNTLQRSHSIKETSRYIFQGLRSLSFKMIGRSKSVKESGDLHVSQNGRGLAPPNVGGTLTSETSGAEVSHDEVDASGKPKKKKRKFKFPFSKKKKDKSKSEGQ